MCKKRRFDLIGAKLAVAQAQNSKKNKRAECRYYWCGACGAYHLTSKRRKHGRDEL